MPTVNAAKAGSQGLREQSPLGMLRDGLQALKDRHPHLPPATLSPSFGWQEGSGASCEQRLGNVHIQCRQLRTQQQAPPRPPARWPERPSPGWDLGVRRKCGLQVPACRSLPPHRSPPRSPHWAPHLCWTGCLRPRSNCERKAVQSLENQTPLTAAPPWRCPGALLPVPPRALVWNLQCLGALGAPGHPQR